MTKKYKTLKVRVSELESRDNKFKTLYERVCDLESKSDKLETEINQTLAVIFSIFAGVLIWLVVLTVT